MTTCKQNLKTIGQNKCIATVNTAAVGAQNWLKKLWY